MENQVTKEVLEKLVNFIENKEKVSSILVVTSIETGADFTYKLTGIPKGVDNYFISMYYEIGYLDFVKGAYHFHDTQMLDKGNNSGNIKGAYWLLKYLMKKDFDFILDKTTISHTGNCLKCNRELTDAESIEYGMGKTCRGK